MRLIRQIEVLKGAVSVPVILENMPCLPHEGIYYQIFPQYINQVIEETGCGFLLDIAHARIASKALNMCFVDYLYQLPLEKVVQVHISGPRLKLGRLHDTHEPLQELDYELLEWVLDNTRPKILTLEYFRDKRALRDQLYRLRDMVDKNNLTV